MVISAREFATRPENRVLILYNASNVVLARLSETLCELLRADGITANRCDNGVGNIELKVGRVTQEETKAVGEHDVREYVAGLLRTPVYRKGEVDL